VRWRVRRRESAVRGINNNNSSKDKDFAVSMDKHGEWHQHASHESDEPDHISQLEIRRVHAAR
jgi:hypothetical protein